MTDLRVIFPDQLNINISSLHECNKKNDIILLCEVLEEASYVRHHKKKLVLLFSAMRHFAKELENKGYNVCYVKLDDKKNTGTITKEVARAMKTYKPQQIIASHPGEYRQLQYVKNWQKDFEVPVTIKADNRFLCDIEEFSNWSNGRKQLRMEFFYREMRKKYAVLMEGSDPVGGQWNYDAENRKSPLPNMDIPSTYTNKPDAITKEVMLMVGNLFPDNFGDLEPFSFAVTRRQALIALGKFVNERLALFGDYQDIMLSDNAWIYHSHISFYLNCGLLTPLECIQTAEQAYYSNKASINSVEGFIRQILGWREFVRGIYWLKMPQYAKENFLKAKRSLPNLYWTGNTNMNCLKNCVADTKTNAYAHHIQRLMVLGNFALLAGVNPEEVNEWFLIVYADAYEWVEMPNVSGMILYADGGFLASKPYAAGGSYINKMSDYCKGCHYKVSKKDGAEACPFNYLYWDFLARNKEKLSINARLAMMYKTYQRMSPAKREQIKSDAKNFLQKLDSGDCV